MFLIQCRGFAVSTQSFRKTLNVQDHKLPPKISKVGGNSDYDHIKYHSLKRKT